jgi:hypothetical protein
MKKAFLLTAAFFVVTASFAQPAKNKKRQKHKYYHHLLSVSRKWKRDADVISFEPQ